MIPPNGPKKELIDASVLTEKIQHGELENYPLDFLNASLLQEEPFEVEGKTLYHWAAEHGLLKNIPQALLTSKTLLLTDEYGTTCLDFASGAMQVEELPSLPLQSLLDIQDYYIRRHVTEEIQKSRSNQNPYDEYNLEEEDPRINDFPDNSDSDEPYETNTVEILRWAKTHIEEAKKLRLLKVQSLQKAQKTHYKLSGP
jgi:hypothetical protein